VCYSILIMNTAVPLIDRFTQRRVFGTRKAKAA
jgi:electron transport complex protein RnfD